jgi:hypothetical protein
MAWTFSMVCVAWVFFRAESVGEAVEYLGAAFFESEATASLGLKTILENSFLISLLIAFEFFQQRIEQKDPSRRITWSAYILIILLLILFAQNEAANFIYFQF